MRSGFYQDNKGGYDMEDNFKDRVKYLAALSVLRHIDREGTVGKTVLERINRRNAEVTGCFKIDL